MIDKSKLVPDHQGSPLDVKLATSLRRQNSLFEASIVLTPVDSFTDSDEYSYLGSFLRGLYVSDKARSDEQRKAAIIQFAGRERATRDITDIHREFARRIGASESSLRLLSGLHAHIIVFMTLASIGDSVLVLPETAGAHFATRRILERLGLRVVDMVVDSERFCINADSTRKVAHRERPDFVFVDRSEGLRYEDFRFLGELENTIKIFDTSQYLSQIICGRYANPLSWGFDLVLFTLHKSFPGPQKAGVASATSGPLWQRVQTGLSDFVSSSHPENSYKAGFALSKTRELNAYTARIIDYSVTLEILLRDAGVPVFERRRQGEASWPATQHIWIPLGCSDSAFAFFKALSAIRIQTNYRWLPYGLGWGLRLGTTVLATSEIRASELNELAQIISSVLKDGFCLNLRHRVRNLATTFSGRRTRAMMTGAL